MFVLVRNLLFFIVLMISDHSMAQMPERTRLRYDSLYTVAQDETLAPKQRLIAYAKAGSSVYRDLDYGEEVCTELLKYAREQKDAGREALALEYLGYVEMMRGNVTSARLYYIQCLNVAVANNKPQRECSALADLGNLANFEGDLDSALYYNELSLTKAENINYPIYESRACLNIGGVYKKKGDFRQSLTYLNRAKTIIEARNVVGYYASLYNEFGEVYMMIQEFDSAEKYFKKADSITKKIFNHGKRIETLGELGELAKTRKQYSQAFNYFNEGLQIAQTQKSTIRESEMRLGLAILHFEQSAYELALIEVSQSIELKKKQKTNRDIENHYYWQGKIYSSLEQFDSAKVALETAYQRMQDLASARYLRSTCELLYNTHKILGNEEQAFHYLEEFNVLQSIYDDEETVKELLAMELREEYQQKQFRDSLNRIRNQDAINAKHEQAINSRNSKIYIATVVIIALLIILLIFIFFWRNKSKLNRDLNRKNLEIEQSLKDKTFLLKELHHRVKNNMQVASSVLQLKAKNTSSKVAKEALIESRLRLQSMQIAHQRIFESDDHDRIDLVQYAHELCHALKDSVLGSSCSIEINGSQVVINIEEAQATGFILHELLTNSAKHAWENNDEQQIHISIVEEGEKVSIQYRDNGKGLPKGFELLKSKAFGMKFIHSMVKRQLRGEMTSENNNGARFTIKFVKR